MAKFVEQEVMKNKGYEHFYFCLEWLKFVGVQFGVKKTIVGGLLQSFFEQEIMKNKGYEHFYFCLKWLKFVGGSILRQEYNCWP